ncbi:hypothetical protein [Sinomonas terrae]|uniref:Uncharacterized protein n=1 Tax=Sinomonas terrae TaxID=2908838 RepID=A0ABS9TZN8_9MICC|nr:hypothetical protein [Sinomonas terrae]MCH6469897.1 hypothetical protein [Sinomonas terrae]
MTSTTAGPTTVGPAALCAGVAALGPRAAALGPRAAALCAGVVVVRLRQDDAAPQHSLPAPPIR